MGVTLISHFNWREGSYQISPFTPNMKWDITETPMIEEFSCDEGYCDRTGDIQDRPTFDRRSCTELERVSR